MPVSIEILTAYTIISQFNGVYIALTNSFQMGSKELFQRAYGGEMNRLQKELYSNECQRVLTQILRKPCGD